MYKPDNNEQVTTFEQLSEYAGGRVVRLPDFAEGQPLVVRMVRPSLLVLAKSGKIPNRLLAAATELFQGKPVQNRQQRRQQDQTDDVSDVLAQTYDVMKVIAEASLKEPTLQEIEEAGMELTDEQLLTIFNYSQAGTRALDRFRQKQQRPATTRDGAAVQPQAVGNSRNK